TVRTSHSSSSASGVGGGTHHSSDRHPRHITRPDSGQAGESAFSKHHLPDMLLGHFGKYVPQIGSLPFPFPFPFPSLQAIGNGNGSRPAARKMRSRNARTSDSHFHRASPFAGAAASTAKTGIQPLVVLES